MRETISQWTYARVRRLTARSGLTPWFGIHFLRSAVFFFIAFHASAQADSIHHRRLTAVIAGTATAYTASIIWLNKAWYSQHDRQSFHFFDDRLEWKQADKWGHFYSSYQLTSIHSEMLQWSGVKKNKSALYGAVASFAMMASIEVMDGFSAGYGASVSDLAANALGSGLFLGQSALWQEQRILPKYSFHRTDLAPLRPGTLGNGLAEEIVKDYNGQTQWLSVDMNKFCRFPKWLNFSVGWGAENMLYARDAMNIEAGYIPYRQFYVGLDFDLTAIQTRSRLVKSLIYFANMIRLPAPALEFSQKKMKAHLFYF